MKQWMFIVVVAAVFVLEAAWSASSGGDGSLTRVVDGAHDVPDARQTLSDPLHAWNADNTTLDAILASAVWPGARACLRPAGCTGGTQGVQRPL